ncbi:hypothetical protein BDF20DRAFT_856162 [Mycotypha africana]|uniref:uncharacterized protein n=1 Tax=Mycotypha africana TaxID=64632 RepID=UPI002301A977|nr:uncharacterized protein BDF20DRAFT_856162 [Mycotypha africana]KAI8988519.1 hypothetical protein BDF20DRAFT_856162 [Mycotypha africana]
MSQFVRPKFNVDDDDLERLQQEFFAYKTTPSAKVYRKEAPPSVDQSSPKNKGSLFAERTATATAPDVSSASSSSSMPRLENLMPTLEDASTEDMPSLESIPAPESKDKAETPMTIDNKVEEVEYEPVMDPHPEPHVPVSKKVLDLTSMLGQVLGEITEKEVGKVTVPSLPNPNENVDKPARDHQNGFPKPVHRSEFKKRLDAQRLKKEKMTQPRIDTPPKVRPEGQQQQQQSNGLLLNNSSIYEDENIKRIEEMSNEELAEARQEIMNTLSPESISILMKGLKKGIKVASDLRVEQQQKQQENEGKKEQDESKKEKNDDLLEMKRQYFADVPTEYDKLAWIDDRFLTKEMKQQEEKRKNKLREDHPENKASEAEKIYRKTRFDLQGHIVDDTARIPPHTGLYHHGDDPDKAGYTLAELFYLTRSHVPAQRSMVLNTIARIITNTKKMIKNTASPHFIVWSHVHTILTGKEHAAIIYLRSALDDKNLAVLVSAIKALSALLLDDEPSWEDTLAKMSQSNQFFGHLHQPILKSGSKMLERKGLNEKLSELIDRVRQSSGQSTRKIEDQMEDAELAERDLIRGLIHMNILDRIRYLLASNSSELIENDPVSVETLIRMLLCMAESGQDVCEAIDEAELIEPVVEWGVFKTQWPMTDDKDNSNYPSTAVVRLLTTLAQGSKTIAENIVGKATTMLRFLITSPEIAATDSLKQKAYALQMETLKLIRVLASYGFILPSLEDLQEPIMGWLRAAMINNKCSTEERIRAAAALTLLEVLLHIAADPHKSVPAHAIEWHQPVAYLPAVTAVLRAQRRLDQPLVESALGYLSAWASHIELFPPEAETVRDVWKAVVQEEENVCYATSNHILRYIQFIIAYIALSGGKAEHKYRDLILEARDELSRTAMTDGLKKYHEVDVRGRYAFWLWLTYGNNQETLWVNENELNRSELECAVVSRQFGGQVEAWLSQEFLQLSFSKQELDVLEPFYFEQEEKDRQLSKALFTYDGRPIQTLMYNTAVDGTNSNSKISNSFITSVFILSPIDALYHLDKSQIAQKSRAEPAVVISRTLQLASQLFDNNYIQHEVAIISLMKIFLIGDREGRMIDMVTDRELFRDDNVSKHIDEWLDYLCSSTTDLLALEHAWQMSSEFIRQAQVPFYQFYQSFVAQYASVSFGHHGMARLLVYLVTQIKTVDYRRLIFNDYREILRTLTNVSQNEIPNISVEERKELENAGLKLSESK